jgi:hypothetical protein
MELLHEITISSRQRVDIVEHCLRRGSPFKQDQDITPWADRYTDKLIATFPGEYIVVHSRWHPLRQAVKGSNTKIVRLLLERGALANATGSDLLHLAVRTGCLSNVRLLVDHGADVNYVPQWPTDTQLQRDPFPPIVEAICLEQENVARYLHEHGATLISTLDDARRGPARQVLTQFPDSKWRLALRLSQCERGEEKCGSQCFWKAKYTTLSPLRARSDAPTSTLAAHMMGGSELAGW